MNLRDSVSPAPSAGFCEQRSAGVDGVVRSLIQRAAHRAPPALSQRLEEEWLADLAARRGAIPRLRFALGCAWATRVIACELGAPARAAATATGDNTAAVCAPRFNSRRTTVVVVIAVVHGLVIYGLATGMAHQFLAVISGPMQVTPFPQKTPRIEAPPPIKDPQLAQLHVDVSSPPIGIDLQQPPDGVAVIRDVEIQVPSAPVQPPSQPQPVNRVVGGPGAGFPNTDNFYPDAARRLAEKGAVTIRVCVDSAGRLTSDPSVAQSSGSIRLDQGAQRLARAGSGYYRATTENGRPVNSCYPFRVRFELTDRVR